MDGVIAYILSKKYTDKKIGEIPGAFRMKAAVPTYDDLPTSGNESGDVREVLDSGTFYFWDGDEWQILHSTEIEIDTALDPDSHNAVENKAIYEGILWEKGTGENSAQLKNATNSAEGDYSTAEGLNTLAKSNYSHTEGWATRTIIDDTDPTTGGHASHAEGSHTVAKGVASHAEGNTTESMGWHSHAEGSGSISGGISSHAEGDGTLTNNYAEHAEGTYNKSKPSTTASSKDGTLHSVGIGTLMNDRKNAHEIMQNGDQYIIRVGDYDGTNPDDADTVQNVINNKQDKDLDAEPNTVAVFDDEGNTISSDITMGEAVGMDILVSTDSTPATDEQIPTALWVKGASDDKQDKDPEAELGTVAIFNNEGSTVGSGVVMEEADTMNVLLSTSTAVPSDTYIPTAKWVDKHMQEKVVTVGSGTTVFVDSQEVPKLDKTQVTTAYNAFIAGIEVLILDTLHDDYYQVNQAMHRIVDGNEELTISINVHNATFVDYTYNNGTDAVTVTSTFKTVSQSDVDYWDAKADKATLTKTTSNDVVLTNGDTTVVTQQIGEITVGFDLPDDPEEDFVSSVIFKPYDLFIFHADEPAGYALTWGTDVPSFESGSVYELVFKVLGITGPGGNVLISGKWSKVA